MTLLLEQPVFPLSFHFFTNWIRIQSNELKKTSCYSNVCSYCNEIITLLFVDQIYKIVKDPFSWHWSEEMDRLSYHLHLFFWNHAAAIQEQEICACIHNWIGWTSLCCNRNYFQFFVQDINMFWLLVRAYSLSVPFLIYLTCLRL